MSSKKQCANCYWWDAAPVLGGEGERKCHEPSLHKGGVKTFGDDCCGALFRLINPDDPATTWNRKQPGRKTRSPRAPKDPAAVKRGRAAKKKGKRGEDEWAKHVVGRIGGNQIWEHGDRDPQWEKNGLEGIRNEVKRYVAFSFTKHCHQVIAKAAKRGLSRWLVAWRPDCKPHEHVQWFVTVDADGYLDDMQELHERRAKNVG